MPDGLWPLPKDLLPQVPGIEPSIPDFDLH